MRSAGGALLASAVLLGVACGRTGLNGGEGASHGGGGEGGVVIEPPVDECQVDSDCPRDDACSPAFCRPPDDEHEARYCEVRVVACDDRDPCTEDRCDPDSGRCEHEGGGDNDHDGYRGKALDGTPSTCGGSDCDDDDALVFPGAQEICDGKDNDCNGAIDEGATYRTLGQPVLVAPSSFQSLRGGLAFDGTSYGVTYTDVSSTGHKRAYFELLNVDGAIVFGPSPVSEINADTFAGSLATSGRAFFAAWADARQAGGYEIYGTRFNPMAEKLEADQRLTDAPGYSLNPSATFVKKGYRVVWEDRRFTVSGGPDAIYGRKLGLDGHADGDEVRLTTDDEDADFPDSAVSETRLGVTYVVTGPLRPDGSDTVPIVRFRSFDHAFADDSGHVDLGNEGQEPAIVRTKDTFVVAWHTGGETGAGAGWGPVLQGAALDDRGTVLASGPITVGDVNAKDRALVSLGDRVLVIWSAKPDDPTPYQLYFEIISARDLSVITPRQILMASASRLSEPIATLGPTGDVGVMFKDDTADQVYFTHLGCTLPPVRPANDR
ncbi:MAG TPA: putative metal-binding motif-containing protein [Polyangiaceae bacterium]|nr:putative metal-binding motif-containing protein [Polyangiaceae bacterium]